MSDDGKLFVTVHEAQDIKDTQMFGKQDPFASIQFIGKTVRTPTHKNGGTAPKWGAVKFTFPISSSRFDEFLWINVKNENVLTSALCGFSKVKLTPYANGARHEIWVRLRSGGAYKGQIRVTIQVEHPRFAPVADTPAAAPAAAPAPAPAPTAAPSGGAYPGMTATNGATPSYPTAGLAGAFPTPGYNPASTAAPAYPYPTDTPAYAPPPPAGNAGYTSGYAAPSAEPAPPAYGAAAPSYGAPAYGAPAYSAPAPAFGAPAPAYSYGAARGATNSTPYPAPAYPTGAAAPAYGSAPAYGRAPSYSSGSAPAYSSGAAPAYGSAASGYHSQATAEAGRAVFAAGIGGGSPEEQARLIRAAAERKRQQEEDERLAMQVAQAEGGADVDTDGDGVVSLDEWRRAEEIRQARIKADEDFARELARQAS